VVAVTTKFPVVSSTKPIDLEVVQIPCLSTKRTTYDRIAPPDRPRGVLLTGNPSTRSARSVRSSVQPGWALRPVKSEHSLGRYMLGGGALTRISNEMPIIQPGGYQSQNLIGDGPIWPSAWPIVADLSHPLWPFGASAERAHGAAPTRHPSPGRRGSHGSRDSSAVPRTLSMFRAIPPSRFPPDPA
jgi:hypothetical protein